MLPRFSGYDASGVAAPLMSAMAADMTYSLLQGVAQQGTGWRAMNILGDDYALAGKTGTAGKGRELVFVGFARDLVALLWVGVVSGNGAVSSQHASDVVVEPWARILRAYGPHDDQDSEQRAAPEVTPDQLRGWISRFVHIGSRQKL